MQDLEEILSDDSIYGNRTEINISPTGSPGGTGRGARRVVSGMPNTRHFTGASSYPMDSFVDPNSDYFVFGAETDSEGDSEVAGGDFTYETGDYDTGTHGGESEEDEDEDEDEEEEDEEDTGDNWTDDMVRLEWEVYLQDKGGVGWESSRSGWLSDCIVRRGGLRLEGVGGVDDVLRGDCEVVEGGGDDCIICLCGFEAGGRVELGCGHGFHRACLRKWLYRSRQCPTCRRGAVRGGRGGCRKGGRERSKRGKEQGKEEGKEEVA
ncbi:hypothetical protein TrRE_jg5823 [Triparma retinervis]|uniref:RING-type domain-containing protein n=1 Tax=Triparma retinervis TaxID=2557542 RepID=A0A9W7E596_9STRA|nr:hypothetical protein TrRE_jg5823 [Triparma retinervis]